MNELITLCRQVCCRFATAKSDKFYEPYLLRKVTAGHSSAILNMCSCKHIETIVVIVVLGYTNTFHLFSISNKQFPTCFPGGRSCLTSSMSAFWVSHFLRFNFMQVSLQIMDLLKNIDREQRHRNWSQFSIVVERCTASLELNNTLFFHWIALDFAALCNRIQLQIRAIAFFYIHCFLVHTPFIHIKHV